MNTDANDNIDEIDQTRQPFPGASLDAASDSPTVTADSVLCRGRNHHHGSSLNLTNSSCPSIVSSLDQLKAQLVHEQDRRALAEDWSTFLMATLRGYLSARDVFINRRPRIVGSATTAQFETKPRIESMKSVEKNHRSDVLGCLESNVMTSSREHPVVATSSQFQPITDDGSLG